MCNHLQNRQHAALAGGQGVVGSNPATPTKNKPLVFAGISEASRPGSGARGWICRFSRYAGAVKWGSAPIRRSAARRRASCAPAPSLPCEWAATPSTIGTRKDIARRRPFAAAIDGPYANSKKLLPPTRSFRVDLRFPQRGAISLGDSDGTTSLFAASLHWNGDRDGCACQGAPRHRVACVT